MLTCKQKNLEIEIYKDDKLLGDLYVLYPHPECWGFFVPGKYGAESGRTLGSQNFMEYYFFITFGQKIDSVTNLRKMMEEILEIKQAELLMKKLSESGD